MSNPCKLGSMCPNLDNALHCETLTHALEEEIAHQLVQGNNLFHDGEHLRAAVAYTKLIKSSPSVHAYSNRSACFLELNKVTKALADAKKCVTLDPSWVQGHVRLGSCYEALGKTAEMTAAVEVGLKLDPENAELAALLGNAAERAPDLPPLREPRDYTRHPCASPSAVALLHPEAHSPSDLLDIAATHMTGTGTLAELCSITDRTENTLSLRVGSIIHGETCTCSLRAVAHVRFAEIDPHFHLAAAGDVQALEEGAQSALIVECTLDALVAVSGDEQDALPHGAQVTLAQFKSQMLLCAVLASQWPGGCTLVDVTGCTVPSVPAWLAGGSSPVLPPFQLCFSLHGMAGPDDAWIHTHGLRRFLGTALELEVLRGPPALMEQLAALLNVAACAVLFQGERAVVYGSLTTISPLVPIVLSPPTGYEGTTCHGNEADRAEHLACRSLDVSSDAIALQKAQDPGGVFALSPQVDLGLVEALAPFFVALCTRYVGQPGWDLASKFPVPTPAGDHEHMWFEVLSVERPCSLRCSCVSVAVAGAGVRKGEIVCYDVRDASGFMVAESPFGQFSANTMLQLYPVI